MTDIRDHGMPVLGWLAKRLWGRLLIVPLCIPLLFIDALIFFGLFLADWLIGGEKRMRDKGWIP